MLDVSAVCDLMILRPTRNKPEKSRVLLDQLFRNGRHISVGIALGYELDDQGSRVRFSAGAGNFCLHHRVRNGSGSHPASYPIGIRGSFPGGKVAGA
jgi:hypothetical protein